MSQNNPAAERYALEAIRRTEGRQDDPRSAQIPRTVAKSEHTRIRLQCLHEVAWLDLQGYGYPSG